MAPPDPAAPLPSLPPHNSELLPGRRKALPYCRKSTSKSKRGDGARKSPFGSHRVITDLGKNHQRELKLAGGSLRGNRDSHVISKCLPTRY